MRYLNHKLLAVLIFVISIYATFIVASDLGALHQQAKSFLEPNAGVWPNALVFAAVISPLVIVAAASMVYFNKRSIAVFVLVAYAWFFIVSYTSYILVALTLIWWFSPNESNHT